MLPLPCAHVMALENLGLWGQSSLLVPANKDSSIYANTACSCFYSMRVQVMCLPSRGYLTPDPLRRTFANLCSTGTLLHSSSESSQQDRDLAALSCHPHCNVHVCQRLAPLISLCLPTHFSLEPLCRKTACM